MTSSASPRIAGGLGNDMLAGGPRLDTVSGDGGLGEDYIFTCGGPDRVIRGGPG